MVDIVPVSRLHRSVTLAEIKRNSLFAGFPLVRMPRLSVMPVGESEWAEIERLSKTQE